MWRLMFIPLMLMAAACSLQSGDNVEVTIPVTPTQTSAAPPPAYMTAVQQGSIHISDFDTADAGNYALSGTTTLTWTDMPLDVARIVYLAMPSGWALEHAGPGTIEVGETPANQPLEWTVPPGMDGLELVAFGYHADGRLIAYSFQQYVYSE